MANSHLENIPNCSWVTGRVVESQDQIFILPFRRPHPRQREAQKGNHLINLKEGMDLHVVNNLAIFFLSLIFFFFQLMFLTFSLPDGKLYLKSSEKLKHILFRFVLRWIVWSGKKLLGLDINFSALDFKNLLSMKLSCMKISSHKNLNFHSP